MLLPPSIISSCCLLVVTGDGSDTTTSCSLSSFQSTGMLWVPVIPILSLALTLLLELNLLKTKVSSKAKKKESQEPKILLVDLHDPQSIKSLLCIGGVVLVTLGFYFYYKQSEKRFRSQLEKPRDGIEGSHRMIGYSR